LVVSTPGIAAQLATDRGIVASKQSGKLPDVVLSFHQAINLISFNLAGVFEIHRATSTYRSGSPQCKTSSASLLRLVNVAFVLESAKERNDLAMVHRFRLGIKIFNPLLSTETTNEIYIRP